jgi:FkbM family methyltransferase
MGGESFLMKQIIQKILRKLSNMSHAQHDSASYGIGRVSIRLPNGHRLPEYQKKHKQYDRFLPHLVKEFNRGDIVIDVGANCGDTLAGMVSQNPNLHYICIEADGEFYSYLIRNTARIKEMFPDTSINLVHELISDGEVTVGLTGEGGTKHRDETAKNGLTKATRLEDVVARLAITKNVRLIKSDVDGYDYDVVNSARRLLECEHLMIFFECQCFNIVQRDGFIQLLGNLFKLGFSDFRFFDNFGSFMVNTSESKLHRELIDYVMYQNEHRATRTIDYFDILASKPSDHRLLSRVVDEYSELY